MGVEGEEGMKMTDQIAILVGELEDFFSPSTSDHIEPVDIDRNQSLIRNSEEDRAFKVVQGITTSKEAAEEMRNRTETMRQRDLAEFKSRNINITSVITKCICISSCLPAEIEEAFQNQIHDLALLRHSEKKPQDFGTLVCMAMVYMPVAEEENAQYGLVFKLEEGQQAYTLVELLTSEDSTPKSPTERLNLVKMLSKTLL
ncbi:Uncharacterized protein Y057_13882 [Fusarium fujikuroi]|nr:Uncharacterized protein Y057_13882 [Fusarium fujikuroi]